MKVIVYSLGLNRLFLEDQIQIRLISISRNAILQRKKTEVLVFHLG